MKTPKETGLLITACAAGAVIAGFAQQAPKQLTARELFYSASVSKPNVPRPQTTPQKSTPPKQTAPPPSTQATPPRQVPAVPALSAPVPSSTSAPIVTASDRVQTAPPPAT